ncbi:MAG: SIS domain-containing protein [Erysipelotrichaceae bacterium]|nr:SIS domain-containing protein [Erysipelotrichaceae bacterium]
METNVEIMAKHISAQAEMFGRYAKDLYQKCLTMLKKYDAKDRIKKVYITGCGDSYFAGICVRDFFLNYAGVHTEARHAMELSRYILPYEVDENSLVVSISASGAVARTAECAIRAGEKGAISIGITTNPKGRLAEVAPDLLSIQLAENLGLAPGTQSYCASLLSLYCLGTALGYLNGTIGDTQVNHIFSYIAETCEAMRKTAEADSSLIRKYIEAYFKESNPFKVDMYHVLAEGPNWGTAQFAVMKLLEAAGFDSIAQGIEEWAHSQYFTTRPSTHTIVIAPKGKCHERALEILGAVTVKDGKKIVIGEENDDELRRAADIYLPIIGMGNIEEEFSPLVYAIPLELLAMHISDHLGRSGFDFENKPWVKEENFRQIFGSRIVTLKEEEDGR